MRKPWRKGGDLSEAILGVSGAALAGGSLVFAWHMMSGPARAPQIVGIEHFAIYAKPSGRTTTRRDVPRNPNVDYAPVGSIGAGPNAMLASYEILDATRGAATVRLPEGRVTQVPVGGRLVGLGRVMSIDQRNGKWLLMTEKGVIRQR